MSYNDYATRENVRYRALVSEPLKGTTFCVDLLDCEDGLGVADDPLILTFPEDCHVQHRDIIYLTKTNGEFLFEFESATGKIRVDDLNT